MSITDELRKWAARELASWKMARERYDALLDIADRIDAEHEKATSEFWQKVNAVPATDENMAEHGWIRLPVDADGEPIHVGDRMTPNGMGTDFKVRQMHFNGEWSLDLEGFGISQTCPDMCHHHHAPTVEDTLLEMLYKAHIYDEREMELLPDLIAEYAAKLRLAGDE